MNYAKRDKKYCWHPFTQHSEWNLPNYQPTCIERGEGVWLFDVDGKRYLDANASIWTNIHGHNHPAINASIQQQLEKIAHCSFLGYTHPQAIQLAEKLTQFFPSNTLSKVFFSDNGSTATEVALRMSLQAFMQSKQPHRQQFISFHNSYHGDTLGAVSVGGQHSFFERFRLFKNQVHFISHIDELATLPPSITDNLAGVIIEPLVQGVNEINVWAKGMLQKLAHWTKQQGAHLILDEVMTGFGRTGSMFACQQEDVIPDFLCLAKGLTNGYLPLAATLTNNTIYEAFLGDSSQTLYYGHSFTANPLGCAAALANLELFDTENTLTKVQHNQNYVAKKLTQLKNANPFVYATRQCGMVIGINLRKANGNILPPQQKVGKLICEQMKKHGVLTRPILDTIVLLPPLTIQTAEIDLFFSALANAITELQDIFTTN